MCEGSATYNNHTLLKRQAEAEVGVEALMPKLQALDRVVLLWLARAWNVVHVEAERVAQAVGEERGADAARENRLLGVPRTRVGGLGGLEDPESLEATNERAVAQKLHGIPVQTRLQSFHRELR